MPALLQTAAVPGDKAANLATMRRAAAMAALAGAEVLVMPEMFLTGYNLGDRIAGLAEPLDGPSVAEARAIARQNGVALVFGMPEADGGRTFNTAVAIAADGRIAGRYRKIHLFGGEEPRLFAAGDTISVIPLGAFRVGLAVCYDIEFPEMARALVRAGADIVCVPTANMAPYVDVPTTLVRARALENGVPVVYANLVGREGDLVYTGLSAIVGFDGRDLARAGGEEEAFLACRSSAVRRPDAHPLASTQLRDLRAGALATVDGRRPG
jgi:predicted amidohydrolase